MKIGIVGAGIIGGTLVRKLRASGHGVRVANSRGPESLSGLAAETADNRYEIGTDTFVVKDGKIVTQTFAGKITPKH